MSVDWDWTGLIREEKKFSLAHFVLNAEAIKTLVALPWLMVCLMLYKLIDENGAEVDRRGNSVSTSELCMSSLQSKVK